MSPEKLAYMANQIGKFFAHQKHDQAVASIADHVLKFWDPRMRRDILAHLADVKLDPLVKEAVEQIRESQVSQTTRSA
jgi:formate dehydrogenase subunit delta